MRIVGWSLLVVSMVACDAGTPAASYSTRDSAGIRIVETARPATGTWKVDSVPLVTIGSEEDGPDYQLFRVRSVRKLSNGSFVVANAGASELRIYDATGLFQQRIGRAGGGPGEFGEFASMETWVGPDDSLTVTDSGNDRINLFAGDGTFVQSVRLEPTDETPRLWLADVFDDRTWLVMGPVGGGRLQGAAGSLIEMAFAYARHASDGARLHPLLVVDGRKRYVHETGGMAHYPFIPLSQEPLVVAFQDGIVTVTGAEQGLEIRDRDGALRTILRWDVAAAIRTRDVWDRYRVEALTGVTSERTLTLYSRFYELDLPLPEFIPLADAVLVDDSQRIWVKRHALPWQDVARWDVLLPEGPWISSVFLPRRFTPHEIDETSIVGVGRDELGVEQVQVLRLLKGEGAA